MSRIGRPLVDEIVGLLATRAPERLEALKRQYPEQREILESGQIAGVTDVQTRIMAETALAGVNTAIEVGEGAITRARTNLKRVKAGWLWGQVLAAVGGASVITTLAAEYQILTYVGGVVSLAASVVPIVGQYYSSGLRASDDLFEAYKTLVGCCLEGEEIERTLGPWVRGGFEGEFDANSAILRANTLARKIKEIVRVM